jgi:hypothetical protein
MAYARAQLTPISGRPRSWFSMRCPQTQLARS